MGFGLLFIGYLMKFVLGLNGYFSVLLGIPACVVMFFGLQRLQRYCHAFCYAKWCSLGLAVLDAACLIDGLCFAETILSGGAPLTVPNVLAFMRELSAVRPVDWAVLVAMLVFHAALAMAVKEIALRVDVKKNAVRALRNLVIVALYAVLFTVGNAVPSVAAVVGPALLLLSLIWAVCNSVMLFSCYMYICPAEQEAPAAPRSTRIGWLARLRERSAEKERRAREADQAYYEQMARERREKQLSRMSEKQRHAEEKKQFRNKK